MGIDFGRLIEVAISGFLTGGIGLAMFNWLRVRKSRARGTSPDEQTAVLQATTGINDPLTAYLKRELIRVREDFRKYRVESERLRRLDAAHIDELEAHIWQGMGPPPPKPRQQKD